MIFAVEWNLFLGRFHPLIVHLPIGTILLSALFLWLSRKEKWSKLSSAIAPILLTSALAATLSAILGLMLVNGESYNPSAVFWHKWLGIATAVLSWLAWITYRSSNKSARLFKLVFAAVLVTLLLAGHFGGQITHGKSYLAQYAPPFLAPILGGSSDTKTDYTLDQTTMDSTEMYRDLIAPLLNDKCIRCHNEDKSNGQLILTSYEAILDGSNSGSILTTGKPFDSKLFSRTTLPQSSSKFMPPDGIPLTYKEQQVLAWWIENGHPNDQKVRELEIPKSILSILEEIYNYSHKPKSFVEKFQVEAVDSSALALINTSGFKAQPIAASTNFLDVIVSADVTELIDEQIGKLKDASEQISWLAIPNKNVGDDLLKSIGMFSNLSKLKIQNNPITDNGLAHLGNLSNLEVLNLYNTKITDQSIPIIQKFQKLKNLYIWQTSITSEGVARLQELLPNTEIVAGLEFNSDENQDEG